MRILEEDKGTRKWVMVAESFLKFLTGPVISEISAWINTINYRYAYQIQMTGKQRQRENLAREKENLTMREELESKSNGTSFHKQGKQEKVD